MADDTVCPCGKKLKDHTLNELTECQGKKKE